MRNRTRNGFQFSVYFILGKELSKPFVKGCEGDEKIFSTDACSTIFPEYMTATRSEYCATIPKLWVIRRMDIAVSFLNTFNKSGFVLEWLHQGR
ncbi:MAG: hypothetical protein Ct9H300mP23_08640 [Nitrospinota bacterium]|nr:MAG: hypothetical protein Ct9H300mP23_08640 [Nitrospinota bacterium]